MKAVLLAAGNGTRLRPLTDEAPKCLLPIQGTPLLDIWLDSCRRSGVSEILLNTHAHHEAVREFVFRRQNGVKIRLFNEPELFGSAGTLAANRWWLASEPVFYVLYADVLTNLDLGAMLEFHYVRRPTVTIGVYRVPDPSRCGIVNLDGNGMVTRFVEKPVQPMGNLAFTGVLLATPGLLDAIPDGRPVDLGHDVLPHLCGQMAAYETADYILDIGTLENYRSAQATWPGLQGRLRCSPPSSSILTE